VLTTSGTYPFVTQVLIDVHPETCNISG